MKMKPLSLRTIAAAVGGSYVGPEDLADTLITGVVRDNREVCGGELFVCIKGERTDGHDFAQKAFDAGASCCLAERPLVDASGPYVLVESTLDALKKLGEYYRGLFDIPVVGIIGSVGKTTAKEMTAAVLSEEFCVMKTPTNLNNEIGVPLTLLTLREEHTAAVVEMGISDFGEMTRLAQMVRPTVCVMTTIGYCHLENLGDLNGVLRAKSEVFPFMPRDGAAVVNGDDKLLAAFDPGIRKITFGYGEGNDYIAENIMSDGVGAVTCTIVGDGRSLDVRIPAYGSHMALAALPALAVGRFLGMDDEAIVRGIACYTTVAGRANVIDTGYIRIIDDCYNANPNSVAAALTSLRALEGRKVAILGDMKELGAGSRDLHRDIGVLAGHCGVDALICLGPEAEFIYKGLISSQREVQAWHFPLKDALFSVLPSLIKKGDNVLVKASHSMHFEEIVEELKKLH